MDLQELIRTARQVGASDVHLEPGLPAALRTSGALRMTGEPLSSTALEQAAKELLGDAGWTDFVERGSHDGSRTICGVRCRITILRTARGVGMAIRILASFQATLERLNLHPDLRHWVNRSHGLILISGPTGCGKSSTLAALLQEINLHDARHAITIESPIEYFFRPRKAFIRQREVGRDTPSFAQALIDALREDPDVILVGEMRDPETMRLTLNASETGHLVMSSVHSSNCVEALQRVVASFSPDIQAAVAAQLADCLVAVMAQRLDYRPDLKIRVPECEILIPTNPVKAHIRNRDFFRIQSVLETGAEAGMFTWERYRHWMSRRSNWFVPDETAEAPDSEATGLPEVGGTTFATRSERPASTAAAAVPKPAPTSTAPGQRIDIEPIQGGLENLLRNLT